MGIEITNLNWFQTMHINRLQKNWWKPIAHWKSSKSLQATTTQKGMQTPKGTSKKELIWIKEWDSHRTKPYPPGSKTKITYIQHMGIAPRLGQLHPIGSSMRLLQNKTTSIFLPQQMAFWSIFIPIPSLELGTMSNALMQSLKKMQPNLRKKPLAKWGGHYNISLGNLCDTS